MAFDLTNRTLKTRIHALLGDRWPHLAMVQLPDEKTCAEEITKAGLFADIADKQAYLRWVAGYKDMIHEIENHILHLKSLRKHQDQWIQADAQSERAWFATAATALIRMRRLGKTWSAEQASKPLQAAE